MTIRLIAAVLLLASAAAPALAAPSDLIKCDGYGGRRGTGESVARGLLVLGTLGLMGTPESDNPGARLAGQAGLDACTQALADPRATGNAVRRAEVLLMRGIRHLEIKQPVFAVADADALLMTRLPTSAEQALFDRTLGVSALLLKAHARLRDGKDAEAEALALQAAARRPWGRFVPSEAHTVLAQSAAISAEEATLLDRMVRTSTAGLFERGQAREAAGDWTGAAADFTALQAKRFVPDEVVEARAAANLALAGQAEAAAAMLAKAQQHVDELAPKAAGTDAEAQKAAARVARADELIQLARAQLAVAGGKLDDAKTLLGGRQRWLAPAPIAAQVIANAQAKLGSGGPGSLSLDPAKLRADARRVARDELAGERSIRLYALAWPRWEDADVAPRFGKDIFAPATKAVIVDRIEDGRATTVRINRVGAAADTAHEAMLVACAEEAKRRGADRFALVDVATAPGVTRTGLVTHASRYAVVLPGDRMFEGQAARALGVADIERDLVPGFPRPAPAR